MLYRTVYSFLFICLLAPSLCAQPLDIKFERIGPEHGLSHQTVTDILQDHQGFIWFTTLDGLNRFDGYTCVVYKYRPDDSTSLSTNFLHSIYEDAEGFLWIGTRNGGLNCFNPTTGRFTRYLHNPADHTTIANNKSSDVLAENEHLLWVGTDSGLDLFDKRTGTFSHFQHNPSDPTTISHNEVATLFKDRSGVLWVGTFNGLNRFDSQSRTFKRFLPNANDPWSLGSGYVQSFYEDADGKLWIGTSAGLNIFNPKMGRFRNRRNDLRGFGVLSRTGIQNIREDSFGRIWFGTTSEGLFLYDKQTGRIKRFTYDPTDLNSIGHNNASAACEDNQGTIWISTWGGGVSRVVQRKYKFTHIVGNPSVPGTLGNNFVFSLQEDRNGMPLVGTSGGAYRYNRTGNIILPIVGNAGLSDDLRNATIWSMLKTRDDAVWLGSNVGLDRIDSETGAIRHLSTGSAVGPAFRDPASRDGQVKSLLESSDGKLWAGMEGGALKRYDPRSGKWLTYADTVIDPAGKGNGKVWTLREDREGFIWAGTFMSGVCKLRPKNGTLVRYEHRPDDSKSLSFNDVRSVYEDKSGTLWMGTYGGGLNKFDRSSETFEVFTEQDGLANNFVYGILEDDAGNLWISTNKGLSKFNPQTKEFKNFTVMDGLQADEFNTGAYFKNAKGEMFFGGVNGFNMFHPEHVKDNPHVPPVVITSFKVFDKEVELDTAITESKTLRLDYNQNFFSFEFAALDFVEPQKNQYSYLLEGFDPGWIQSGNRRYASYTNLDAGSYTLRVKGSNNDGIWNGQGASLRVIIVPPFWMTTWFRTLAVLAIVGTVGGVVRYVSTRKLQKQIHELEKQRALQEERERISRDLHDHTGAQLATIISGLELAGKYTATSTRKTKTMLQSLTDDARSGMGQLRETIWALKTNTMELEQFVNELERYAQQRLRYRRATSAQVRLTGDARAVLSPVQVLNLYRIAQEAITNALKHAKPKSITIAVSVVSGHLILEMWNDGRKEQRDQRVDSGGQGMPNMDRRAKELGGTLEFSSRGNVVALKVRIPLENKA